MKSTNRLLKCSVAAWVMASAGVALAQNTDIWTGTDGANNGLWGWSDANNWSTTTIPTAGDFLVFDGNNGSATNDFPANTAFGGLSFDGGAGNFDLTGNVVNLAGVIENDSPNAQSIDLQLNLTGATTVNATSGGLNLGLNAGGIGGTGPLTINGPNLVVLTNVTYSGGTVIGSNANVQVENDHGNYTMQGGSLLMTYGSWYSGPTITFTADSSLGVQAGGSAYNGYGRYDFYGNIGSPGYKWTVIGSGRFQMHGGALLAGSVDVTAPAVLGALPNGNANYAALGTNTITVESGAALRVNGGGIVLAPIVLQGGSGPDGFGALVANQEPYNGEPTTIVATFSNTVTTVGGDTCFGSQYGSMVIAGNVIGSGSLNKIGNSPLVLSGSNSYSGSTTIGGYGVTNSGGTLQLASAYALPSGTPLSVYANSILDLNGNNASVSSLSDDAQGYAVVDNTSTNPASLTITGSGYYLGTIKNSGGGPLSVIDVGGSVLLDGANKYTGSTLVEGGSLDMYLSSGKTNGALLLATNNGNLNLHMQTPTSVLPASGVTLGASSADTTTLALDLNNYGNVAGAIINATNGTGVLTANGTINVTIENPANLVAGAVHLIKYNTLTGSGTSFVLNTIGNGVVAQIVTNAANHSIDLSIISAPITTWTARVNNNWDYTTTNWIYGGTRIVYQDGQGIYFDDTASNFVVNLAVAPTPGSVLVNTTNTYVFQGSNSLAGGSVTKNGTGTMIVDVSNNTFSSATISAGTLQVGNNDGSGDLGSASVSDQATLAINRTNAITVGNAISGVGQVVDNDSNTVTMNNASSSYTGGTVVNQGTLKLAAANTLGVPATGFNTVTVASGASLDLNGQYLGAGNPVVISGTGAPGRLGALTSVGGGGGMNLGYGNIGVNNLVLAGNATIGTTACNWQIGNSGVGISGNGYVLTILMGNNSLYLRTNALTSPSQVIIGGGKVEFCENTNALGSAAVTLTNGGGFDTWNNNTGTGYSTGSPGLTIYNNVTVGVGGGTLNNDTAAYNGSHGNYDTYAGSYLLNANLTLNNNGQRGGGISKITITGPVSGTGGIVCSQAPTNVSTLSGACTYTGPTLVNGGYLLLSGVQQGGGVFTNNDNAVLDAPNQNGYATLPMSVLALGTNNGSTISFSRLTTLSTTQAPVTATNLVLTGTNSVSLPSLIYTAASGKYPLIKYGSLSGSGSIAVSSAIRGVPAYITNDTANSQIALVIPGGTPVVWSGSTSTAWDIAGTSNWKTNGTATTYQQNGALGDVVTFNDSTTVTNVNLMVPVSPMTAVVSSTNTYTLSGTNITGGSSLVMNGTGTLVLSNFNNNFTGGTVVNSGTLKCATQLSPLVQMNNLSGTVNVASGATFDMGSNNLTSLTINASGSGVNNSGAIQINYTGAAQAIGPSVINLTGNTTIGGNNRFDLRNGSKTLTAVNPNTTLTRTGTGYFGLVGATVSTNISNLAILGGTISFQLTPTSFGATNGTIYIGNGGVLSFYQCALPLVKSAIICSNGAAINSENGINAQNLINTPINIVSNATVNFNYGGGILNLAGPVNIPAGSTVNNNGNYYSTIVYSNVISGSGNFGIQYQSYVKLAASNTYSGNINVPNCNAGGGNVLYLIGNGSISQVPTLTLSGVASGQAAAATLDVSGRTDGSFNMTPNQTLLTYFGSKVNGTVVVGPGSTVAPGGDGGTNYTPYVAPTNFPNVQVSSLTMNGGVLSFDVLTTTNDQIIVTNALNLTGGGSVRVVVTSPLNAGRYHLISFKSKTGNASSLNLGFNGPHYTAHLDDTTTPNWVDLVIDSTNIVPAQNLTWSGDGSLNNWDIAASLNWATNGGSGKTIYNQNDNVTFTDASTNALVTLTTALSPTSLTVNSTTNYTFTGNGSITGGASLTKTGNSTLTLNTYNTFTNGTVVNGGVLALNKGGGAGCIIGLLTINNNATVNLNASDALGYNGGTYVTTVNINGATLYNNSGGNEGYTTSFNLTGGTMSSGGGAYNLSAQTIASLAASVPSVVSAPLTIRNTPLTFNTATGTVPSGFDLIVSGAIGQNGGTYGVAKNGSGTLVLAGNNSYGGVTAVNAGTLLVDGTLGAGGVTVTNATLGGNGTIGGAVTISTNSILAPGTNNTVTSTLTINGALTLNAGSQTIMKINTATATNDLVVATSAAYAGSLTIKEVGAMPALGASYKLFNTTTPTGTFASIVDASGVTWSFDPATGLATVTALPVPPISYLKFIGAPVLNGTTLTVSLTNSGGGTVYLLSSTNLSVPVAQWVPVWTNVFSANGTLTTNVPNAVNPAYPQQFYTLSTNW